MDIFWQIFFRAFLPGEDTWMYMWIILILLIYNIYLVITKNKGRSDLVLKFSLIVASFGTLFGLVLTGDACASGVIPDDKVVLYALAGFSSSLIPLIFHFLSWLILSLISLFVKSE